MPPYRPGRSAEQAAADAGLASAIKLASNESSLPPLPAVAAAIQRAASGINRYPDHLATDLRRSLAASLGVTTDRVLLGAGSVALLQQLCAVYATAGDEIVFGWRSFEAYPILTLLAGATPVAVPLRRQTMDPARLAGALGARSKLVLVATPNNPTGTVLRAQELRRLADAVPDTCLLVVDEAYREFVRGADAPDALALLGDRPNVVVVRTFSKAYGLAGLRVGYAIGPAEVIATLEKTLQPFSVSVIAQAAASAALASSDEVDVRVAGVVSERDRVVRALRSRRLSVPDAQANFVWLPCGSAATGLAQALERRGVVTRPFEQEGVRVTIGTPDENDVFLGALDGAMGDLDVISAWTLPAGDGAAHVAAWIDRLDAVEQRLAIHAHASAVDPARRTPADPASGEQWDAGQVWAHLAEFGAYWLHELDTVLDADAGMVPSFGRVKSDPQRIAAVESAGHEPAPAQFERVCKAIDGLRARVLELTAADWARAGAHSTLGVLDVPAQLEHFHIGHYEEHAGQLDHLRGGAPRG